MSGGFPLATLPHEVDAPLARSGGFIAAPADDAAIRHDRATFESKRVQLFAKRMIDVIGGIGLLVLFSVPAALVALAIRLESAGSPVLTQVRVGKYGRTFKMYKFRTMYQDAEARRAELLDLNEQDGPIFKIRNDPRMTRLGRWLRKLSIDELPQLLNVVRGDMSLVGPRPPLPHEVMVYTDRQLRRLQAKPGLTGLWQVHGRSTLTFEKMVALDLEYIDEWTLLGDVVILAKTLPAVVSTRGAY